MHPNPRKVLPILFLIIVAGSIYWYIDSRRASADNGSLAASGTIEATRVMVAPELGGQVLEVLVDEGQTVQAGHVLVRFGDRLLQAQLNQAEAALELAEANYKLIAVGPGSAERRVAVAAAELELLSAQQALEALYDNANLMAAQAYKEIALADDAIDAASRRQDNLVSGSTQADIDAARASVVLAKDQLERAEEDYEPYKNKSEDNLVRATLLSKLAAAQKAYDSAVSRYNNLVGQANDLDLSLAAAGLLMAEAQRADALRRYELLKDGPDPDAVALAEARLNKAESQLALAKAETTAERLAVARAQVSSAETAVQVIQVQIDKLALYAPSDGIILERSVEPGEITLPGTPLLTLARLDRLTITVYIPEGRYGLINLGQTAMVLVDSYPGSQFEAQVVHIADRAEFTPRNVQTAEGRRTTVFAVELAIENPEGKLKPGMPADVEFR